MEYHENRWFYTYRLMYIVYHIYRYIMEIFYNGISFMGDSGTLWQYRSHFPMKWPMPGSSAAAAEELQGCDLGQFTQEHVYRKSYPFYLYIYIHIYVLVCVCVCMCICIHLYVYVYMYIHIQAKICVDMYI